MKRRKRQYAADGSALPTMAELREFNRAADRWLQSRGEHVGNFRENIQRACRLNNATK